MTDAAKVIARVRELLALDQMEGNAATAGHQEYLHRLAVNVLPALLDVLEEVQAERLAILGTMADIKASEGIIAVADRALAALEKELPK